MTVIDRIPARFLEEPGAHLLLSLDMIILDCGPYFSKVSMRPRQELIGKYVEDAFPSPSRSGKSDATRSIRDSFDRAIANRSPDKIENCRIRLKRPAEMGGEWENRWWTITHVPLVVEDELVAVVQRVEDHSLEMRTYLAVRNQRISNYILYIACVVLLGFITYGYSHLSTKTDRENKLSCQIQARSLPSQHELTHVMVDISKLLITPPGKQEPPESLSTKKLVMDLETYLNNYVVNTSKQPRTRTC